MNAIQIGIIRVLVSLVLALPLPHRTLFPGFYMPIYVKHIGDFNYPRLVDFGAAISGSSKLQCQQVLEELDVYKRLRLSLELLKKEMETHKILESMANAIEEKISTEKRRYLLNERYKAIKKDLRLKTKQHSHD